MRKFKTEWGTIITELELHVIHYPLALKEDEQTESEYTFEMYLHDCMAENGGALVEI